MFQAGLRLPSSGMHIWWADPLGFPTVQTDWEDSTMAPSYPPDTSGNPVLKKNIFAIFLTSLRPITFRLLKAGVGRSSTAMHIQIIRPFRLFDSPIGLKKLYAGAKLPPPPRYFWQPGSEEKDFATFFDQPPTHHGPTA